MTLAVYSSAQALENTRAPHSRYPGENDSERLIPATLPVFKPSFQFVPGESIFTIGSCFARNIERALEQMGYMIPTRSWLGARRPDPQAPAEYLNKYTLPSILTELKWALGEAEFPGQSAFLEVGDGKWVDPHATPGLRPDTLEVVVRRRQVIQEITRDIRNCRVVVLTLGLSEAWYDRENGLYLNALPSKVYLKNHPEKYEAHVLDYEQSIDCLEQIHALLSRHLQPDFKMVVTVSPVPLASTFTEFDVLQANAYSKSVLRTAAEAFHRRHQNVDYLPSFESVTLSSRAVAWQADNRHVSTAIVGLNVTRMVNEYAQNAYAAESEMHQRRADCLALAGYSEETEVLRARAVEALSPAMREMEAEVEAAYNANEHQNVIDLVRQMRTPTRKALLYHVISYSKLTTEERAEHLFQQLISEYPGWALPSFRMGQYLWSNGRREEARKHFSQAVALQPALAQRSPFHTAAAKTTSPA